MSNTIKLSIFSEDKFNALTMLYLQQQNLSNLTPEQILDKYDEAYSKIRFHYEDTRSNRRLVKWE